MRQIQAYRQAGTLVLGMLGKDGSPSCGVEQSRTAGLCPGSGAFIGALVAMLDEQAVVIVLAGIRDDDPAAALRMVDRWLAAPGRGPRLRHEAGAAELICAHHHPYKAANLTASGHAAAEADG